MRVLREISTTHLYNGQSDKENAEFVAVTYPARAVGGIQVMHGRIRKAIGGATGHRAEATPPRPCR